MATVKRTQATENDMAKVDGRMVMAVLGAMAKAKREAKVMKAERWATAWSLKLARLRRGVMG